ncbi:MAG: 2,3-bisphosphoglycerate-dependent phosphoglycerate mutase [Sphingomonadales bacterium]|nr:2,3-bisphosphoglycerate-dependent phosphoglycerate mutase [Sphingomonadales bacterium]MDE2170386.1 2,3-bisphosphoglycerate-dependent phosphoglycerate mutase [Sphingomonadales bacterium]
MRLILVRHGQSTANAARTFTGDDDVPLTCKGQSEAEDTARRLHEAGVVPTQIFCSPLSRCIQTASIIATGLGLDHLTPVPLPGLRERDYGQLTGMNKADAAQQFGAGQVQIWRRSYAIAPPGGESLRDTAARVLAAYVTDIFPAVLSDGPVLVVAHGNSLRALVMTLEHLDVRQVEDLEIATGQALVYTLDAASRIVARTSLI